MVSLLDDSIVGVAKFQVESTHEQTDDVIAVLSHRPLTHRLKHYDFLEDRVRLEDLGEKVKLNFKLEAGADHPEEGLKLVLILLLAHAVQMIGLDLIAKVLGKLDLFHDTMVEVDDLRLNISLFADGPDYNCHLSE